MVEKTFHEIEHEAWSQRASYYDALFRDISTQAIDDILDSLGSLQGKRHLDVACGTGHLVAAASARGAFSEGIDFAQPMIDVARTLYPNFCFRVADAADLPYDDNSQNAVTCSFGLSHMENPQAGVDEAFRVLKVGGRFAFTLWCGDENSSELYGILTTTLDKYVKDDYALPEQWVRLRFADEQVCEAITRQAGFSEPVFKILPIVWHIESAQQLVDLFDKLSVRTKMIIDRQPRAIQQQIYEDILSEAEARRINGVISLAWPALLTVVQKPG